MRARKLAAAACRFRLRWWIAAGTFAERRLVRAYDRLVEAEAKL